MEIKMDSLSSSLLFVFAFLCLTTSTYSQANPSPTDPIYVPVRYKQKQALLPCPIREQKPLVLKWRKEESVISIGEDEYKQFSVSSDEHGMTLTITNPGEKDLGNYSCQLYNPSNFSAVEGMTKYFVVMSDLTIKLEEASTVIEGEKLKIRCLVTSKTPPHRIAWQFGNNTYDESRDRVELSADEREIPNAIFKIDVAVMEDRGIYTCLAYATATSNATTAETFVRVKDKYAALWPFLGICAEVVVLCAIILIYEKKRNKAELEESDTDQSPDQKNTPDLGKESVRQRK